MRSSSIALCRAHRRPHAASLPGVEPGVRRPAIKPWNWEGWKNTSESKPVIHLRKLLVNARHTKLLSTSFDAVLALISDPRDFEAVDGTACRDSCIGSGNC